MSCSHPFVLLLGFLFTSSCQNLTPASRSKIQKPSDLTSPGEVVPSSCSLALCSSFYERAQSLLNSLPVTPSSAFLRSRKTVTASSREEEMKGNVCSTYGMSEGRGLPTAVNLQGVVQTLEPHPATLQLCVQSSSFLNKTQGFQNHK